MYSATVWSCSRIITPFCLCRCPQHCLSFKTCALFGLRIHKYIFSCVLYKTYLHIFLIHERKLFTKQYESEEKHSESTVKNERTCTFSQLKDALSSNCRSSAPSGAESINSNVLYKGHSKTEANTAGFGKVSISNLRDILDESTEETINDLAVCVC